MKRYRNRRLRKYGFIDFRSPIKNYKSYSFIIPDSWEFIVVDNSLVSPSRDTIFSTPDRSLPIRSVYLYGGVYYFCLTIPSNYHYLNIDRHPNCITFWSLYRYPFYTVYWTLLTQTFNSFSRPFFLKLRFRGKGYYIFKNKRQTITPQFGYAHRLYFYAYFNSVIFLSKTQIFMFGLLKSDVINSGLGVYRMRPLNIFTSRGVRFFRQIIYKKQGKVSSYR